MSKEFLYSVKIRKGNVSINKVEGYVRKRRDEQTNSDFIKVNGETSIMYIWAESELEAENVSSTFVQKYLKGESNGKSKS